VNIRVEKRRPKGARQSLEENLEFFSWERVHFRLNVHKSSASLPGTVFREENLSEKLHLRPIFRNSGVKSLEQSCEKVVALELSEFSRCSTPCECFFW